MFRFTESAKLWPFASSSFREFGKREMMAMPGGNFGDDACGGVGEDDFSVDVDGRFSSPGVGGIDGKMGVVGCDTSGLSSGVVLVTRATEPRSELTWLGDKPRNKMFPSNLGNKASKL